MFTDEELKNIDSKYFNIIVLDGLDVTIQSRNTGHWWYLHSTGTEGRNAVVVFHKWQYRHPFHRQCMASSLRQALKGIRDHDRFQMNGRK